MTDYFQTPDLIPKEVQIILDTHNENSDQYKELTRMVGELEKIGWTFDFYLDAVPFCLRKI